MNRKIISIFCLIVILLAVLSSTVNASASAKVFSSSKSSSYNNCGTYAVAGLSTLGYSPCTSSMGAITRDSMLEWIRNTGNGYAMYVHTFGGTGYFNDYYGYSIDNTMISGNWDFVYIDSSNSASSTELANAFHTTGYSNRCFLGWNGSITTANSERFNYYFWLTYVGTSSIRNAAVSAATCVPGSGTSPIKLYGSTTYYGTAR